MSQLESQELFKEADTVLMYHALPDEVQTAAFLDKWYKTKRILIPLVSGDDLILKVYSPDKVVPGYKGIPEPSDDALTVLPSEIDLAVIPGVAFDRDCNRLGRGKGFYDRLIPDLRCPLIGLGFDFQIVDQVPVEIFDRKLDMVITERSLFDRD
jgi:5-formyltetrahydrofolate cyclo-ligase